MSREVAIVLIRTSPKPAQPNPIIKFISWFMDQLGEPSIPYDRRTEPERFDRHFIRHDLK